jgi:hypothetical protein
MARNGSSPPKRERRLRVRSRPLEQIDEAKLAVALAIQARRLIEEAASAAARADVPRPVRREVA